MPCWTARGSLAHCHGAVTGRGRQARGLAGETGRPSRSVGGGLPTRALHITGYARLGGERPTCPGGAMARGLGQRCPCAVLLRGNGGPCPDATFGVMARPFYQYPERNLGSRRGVGLWRGGPVEQTTHARQDPDHQATPAAASEPTEPQRRLARRSARPNSDLNKTLPLFFRCLTSVKQFA